MSPRGASSGIRSTIKSSREIQGIFSESRRVANPLVVALIASTPQERGRMGRVAFVAGKRLGNAVVRNRAKRVLRAAVHRAGGPWATHDIVLIAREGTPGASGADLDRAIAEIVRRSGVDR